MPKTNPTITNALGKPVAEQTQDFFAVFKTVSSTAPELIDKSSYKLTYIVDGTGNVAKPSEETDSARNVIQNFEIDNIVTVVLDQATSTNAPLAGQQTINSIGKPIPYCYSQNGISSESFERRLVFRNPSSPPSGAYDPLDTIQGTMITSSVTEDVNVNTNSDRDTLIGGQFVFPKWYILNKLNKGTEPEPGIAYFSSSFGNTTGSFYRLEDIDPNLESFDVVASCYIDNTKSSSTDYFDLKMIVQLGNAETGVWEDVYSSPKVMTNLLYSNLYDPDEYTDRVYPTFTPNNYFGYTLTVDDIQSQYNTNGGYVDIRIIITIFDPSNLIDGGYVTIEGISFYAVTNQIPSPDNYYVDIEGAALNADRYWESSSYSTWITASSKLSEFHNNIYVETTTQTTFGFDPVVIPFTPQVGDRIRFQYNPNQVYTIYEVITPGGDADNRLKLRLNTAPPTSSLQNFLMYRIDNSVAGDMILDVKKIVDIDDPNNPFTGIILPQYPTENIKNNANQILSDLKSKGIIEN